MLILVPYRGFWNSPALSLLEEGEKFFLLLFNYIISNFFYIVKRVREPRPGFQRNPVAYKACSRPWEPPVDRGVCDWKIFPFRENFTSSRGPTRPDFCFEWSRLSGGRPPAPPGDPLSSKNGRIWACFRLCEPLDPQKLQKYYEIVTKI